MSLIYFNRKFVGRLSFLVATSVVFCSVVHATAAKPIRWLACKSIQQLYGLRKVLDGYTTETGVQFAVNQTDLTRYRGKLATMLEEGRPPDFHAWGTDFLAYAAGATAIAPVGDIARNAGFRLSLEAKSALKSWTYRNQLWGIPYAFDPVVLFYNRDLFDAAGVPPPPADWENRSWTWSSFVETAKKLMKEDHTGRVTQQGVDSMQSFYLWPWYFGGDWTDETGLKSRLTDFATTRGVQDVADLVMTRGRSARGPTFSSGRAAMTVEASTYAPLLHYAAFPWRLAATPWGTQHAVPASVSAFSIGEGSDKEAVWAFVEWLFADKKRLAAWVQAEGGGIAVSSDRDLFATYLDAAGAQPARLDLRVVVDALEYARPIHLVYRSNWPKIDDLLAGAVRLVVSGEKRADDAFQQISAQFQRLLDSGTSGQSTARPTISRASPRAGPAT